MKLGVRTCGLGNVKKLDKHSHLFLASGRQSKSHLCVCVCVFVQCKIEVLFLIRVNMADVSMLLATDQ